MTAFKQTLHSVTMNALIGLLVFAAVTTLHRYGYLQLFELKTYDFWLNQQPRAQTSPITLIAVTEADIKALTSYPITDAEMATALQSLIAQQPAAVGLDIYRDKLVNPGREQLDQVLVDDMQNAAAAGFPSTIVGISLYANDPDDWVKPPPVFDHPGYLNLGGPIGLNDVLPDAQDNTVRRILLSISDERGDYFSFPLQLAMRYLFHQGIAPQPDAENPAWLNLGQARLIPFQSNDGVYVNADAGGYQILQDFAGPATYPTYTWQQLLTAAIPADAIANKIVLIGSMAASVKDTFATPRSPRVYGVALHASAVEQLVRMAQTGTTVPASWSQTAEITWIALWAILGMLLTVFVRLKLRFLPLSILLLAALPGSVIALFFYAGYWVPLVAPALAMLLTALITFVRSAYLEHQERGELMQLFGEQVSPQVAETLWQRREEFKQGQLQGEEITATVLFTDIVGFTTTSEQFTQQAGTAKLLDWLNQYLAEMTHEVFNNQGMINKYIGDAIMAVFGAPIVHDTQAGIAQDAQNAVRAALAMRACLIECNRRFAAANLPPVNMRVGIHTGVLMAGSVGGTERREYTVIGDTVNIAARLEGFDKDLWSDELAPHGCRIIISAATAAYLTDEFILKPIGEVALKGKEEQLAVTCVLDS